MQSCQECEQCFPQTREEDQGRQEDQYGRKGVESRAGLEETEQSGAGMYRQNSGGHQRGNQQLETQDGAHQAGLFVGRASSQQTGQCGAHSEAGCGHQQFGRGEEHHVRANGFDRQAGCIGDQLEHGQAAEEGNPHAQGGEKSAAHEHPGAAHGSGLPGFRVSALADQRSPGK